MKVVRRGGGGGGRETFIVRQLLRAKFQTRRTICHIARSSEEEHLAPARLVILVMCCRQRNVPARKLWRLVLEAVSWRTCSSASCCKQEANGSSEAQSGQVRARNQLIILIIILEYFSDRERRLNWSRQVESRLAASGS